MTHPTQSAPPRTRVHGEQVHACAPQAAVEVQGGHDEVQLGGGVRHQAAAAHVHAPGGEDARPEQGGYYGLCKEGGCEGVGGGAGLGRGWPAEQALARGSRGAYVAEPK